MTGPQIEIFNNGTTGWDVWNRSTGHEGWHHPGWALPADSSRYISKDDPAWNTVLGNAQTTYGDPKIHFNTDDIDTERYLAFGDGARLPTDGTVVYHDANTHKNYIQNIDGSVMPADDKFRPTGPAFQPIGYRTTGNGTQIMPIDAQGQQVSALGNGLPTLPPGMSGWHQANGIITPINTEGDYYTLDTTTGRRNYFTKDGTPISETQYNTATQTPGQPATAGHTASLQSAQVDVPDGMTTPQYPSWATDIDPDVGNQMTAVIARLYQLFGAGTPAQADMPDFPFNTDTGDKSGIDTYDNLKHDFQRIEQQFDAAEKEFKRAVAQSATVTTTGRDAINTAIGTFNSTVSGLKDGDWDSLLGAESTMLDSVKTAVATAVSNQQSIPENPPAGPAMPTAAPDPSSIPPPPSADPSALDSDPRSKESTTLDDLLAKLDEPPLGALPIAGQGGNPLGAMTGLNPLNALGNPMGGAGSALPPITDAIKPMSQFADRAGNDPTEDRKSSVTPLNTDPPLPPTTDGRAPAAAGPTQPGPPSPPGPAVPPKIEATGNPTAKPTVTLPDGTTVDAPNPQAAAAAQSALDKSGAGGDAAQKAYSDTGVELPSDGKNPGARIDPSDMQPGDVLKWHDKTMVAVAPGLVADPAHPGLTHTLDEVMKNQTGFEGLFRPTEVDPTLTAANTAPPLADPHLPGHPPPPHTPPGGDQPSPTEHHNSNPPQQPASPSAAPTNTPNQILPLSGPDTAPHDPAAAAAPIAVTPANTTEPQPAPPSPFEPPHPPPATRTTHQQRAAAGQE